MADLQPYNARALCPKCSHYGVRTIHHTDTHIPGCILKGAHEEPRCCKTEHQCRQCQRCLFRWAEAIATTPPEPVGEWVAGQLAELVTWARRHDQYDEPKVLLRELTVELPTRVQLILEGASA